MSEKTDAIKMLLEIKDSINSDSGVCLDEFEGMINQLIILISGIDDTHYFPVYPA